MYADLGSIQDRFRTVPLSGVIVSGHYRLEQALLRIGNFAMANFYHVDLL